MKHTSRLRFFLFVFCLAASQPFFAQDQLGMRLGRHAGIWSAPLNPAHTALFPLKWDANVVSLDVFGENSYGFIKETSLQNLLRNSGKVVSAASIDDENPLRPGDILQDFFTDKRRMHGTFQSRVMGPSLSLRLGERHTVGIVTAVRGSASSYRVPGSLAYGALDRVPFGTNLTAKPFRMGGMAWAEVGILYALRSEEGSPITMSFGVVPKFLAGFEGFTARSRETFTFRQPTADSLEFDSGNWIYSLTTANADPNGSPSPQINGRGVGVDLGFSMSMPAEDSKDDHDYLWRVGASLTDFGLVRFRKGGAETHEVRFQQTVGVQSDDFMDAQNVQDLLDDVSRSFLGDPSKSLISNEFTIATPAALSLQADYRVVPMVYVAGLWVQRLPVLTNALRRPNTLAAVPRFEHRFGSVSLPVVLNDWRSLRLGLAARLGPLVVGSDNLSSFTRKDRLTGLDFYIGLKINAFSLKLADKVGGLSRRDRKWSSVGCFQF